jgi:hypothetical protein
MPNIEQQQQAKINYDAKYRTALLFNIWYYSLFFFVPIVQYLVL